MSRIIHQAQGTFDIFIDKGAGGSINDQQINISNSIPKQVLTLKEYRIEYTTGPEALATGIIHISMPIYTANLMLDNKDNRTELKLPLSENAVTVVTNFNKKITMSKDLQENFKISVLDKDYEVETNIKSIYLSFNTEFSYA
jgi:hypothetical protein